MPEKETLELLEKQGVYLGTPSAAPDVAFLFPGHGSQYPDMMRDSMPEHPAVKRTFDAADELYRGLTRRTLTERMFSAGDGTGAEDLKEPDVMQPAIFTASMATFYQLAEMGLEADTLLGHSLGELSALTAAGALTFEEGFTAVYHRGVAVRGIEPARRGAMLSIQTGGNRRKVERLLMLRSNDGYFVKSITNSPDQTIVSGDARAIDGLAEACAEQNIAATKLPVSHAFHSSLMAPAVSVFEEKLGNVGWRAPQKRVLSTVLGGYYGEEDVPDMPAILARQLITPFDFQALVEMTYTSGTRLFVEVGPKAILSGLVRKILAGADDASITPTDSPSAGSSSGLRKFATFAQAHGLLPEGRAEGRVVPIGRNGSPGDLTTAGNGATPTADLDVAEKLARVVTLKTGYPASVIDFEKRMVPDLGLNRRTQRAILRAVREVFQLPEDDDFPQEEGLTLNALLNHLLGSPDDPDAAPSLRGQAAPELQPEIDDRREQPTPIRADAPDVEGGVLAVYREKTGYPEELLEPDLDLEADLGVDSVKQAEVLAEIRGRFGLPLDGELDLKELNTIRKVVALVADATPPASPGNEDPEAKPEAAQETHPTETPEERGPETALLTLPDVQGQVVVIVGERTGYPEELLEPDLDLEADLGVDSVKQAEILGEVRGRFGIEVDGELDLKELNTIEKVAAFVVARAQVSVPPSEAEAPPSRKASPERGQEQAGGGPSLDLADVEGGVLAVYRERTGYPEELLEPDLDLEADLGVDSVKQAEILGEVRGRFGIEVDGELDLKELVSISKVVAFVADALRARGGAGGTQETGILARSPVSPMPPNEPVKEVPDDPVPSTRLWGELPGVTARYEPVTVERAYPAEVRDRFSLSDKDVVVVSDRGGSLCAQVVPLLTAEGARVHVVGPRGPEVRRYPGFSADFTDTDDLENAFAAVKADAAWVHALINLYSTGDAEDVLGGGAEKWESEVDAQFNVNFLGARAFYSDLADAKGEAGFFAVTAMGGVFGLEAGADKDPMGGITAGFLKSLKRELPEMHAKAVDFSEEDPADMARNLMREIALVEDHEEIGYVRGTRKIIQVLPAPLKPGEHHVPMELDGDSVVVVSGGSRGITHECVKQLSRMYRPNIVVLGRTPVPGGDEEWLHLDDAGFEEYRSSYMRRAKKDDPSLTPVVIEQQLRKISGARKLHANIMELEAADAKVRYEVCDIADGAQVGETIGRIKDRYGKIDGVIHAAGLESFGTVPKKPLIHSQNVVRVKANGGYNLWRAVEGAGLKFFASFGSISGRFGMDGQVDYTAGGDLLSKLSYLLARKNPHVSVFTIDWTAWAETGMAALDFVRDIQEGSRGLEYMSVEEGTGRFLQELLYGGNSPEVMVFGKLGLNTPRGQLDSLDAAKRRVESPVVDGVVANRLDYPLLERVKRFDAGGSIVASKVLHPEEDLHLADHVVGGAGTFPGVLHVESHAEAASLLCPDLTLASMKNVEFLRFVKHYGRGPLTLSVGAEVTESAPGRTEVAAEIRSDFFGPTGAVLEPDRLHSRGTYAFLREPVAAPAPVVDAAAMMASSREMDLERFYERTSRDIYFGPTFLQLKKVGLASAEESISETLVRRNQGLLASVPSPRFLTAPVVIDNVCRSALLWAYHHKGSVCVPCSIGEVQLYRCSLPGETVYAYTKFTGEEGEGRLRFDFQIIDRFNNLLCDIRDLVLIRIADHGTDTNLLG